MHVIHGTWHASSFDFMLVYYPPSSDWKHGCRPKNVTRETVLQDKDGTHTFDRAHFCMHDNNVLVTAVYVKVLHELQSLNGVIAGFFN